MLKAIAALVGAVVGVSAVAAGSKKDTKDSEARDRTDDLGGYLEWKNKHSCPPQNRPDVC